MKKYNSILIVEDAEIDAFLAEQIIARLEITSEFGRAGTGIEALKYLNHFYSIHKAFPELIIVDLHMPLMDGFEFISNFKSHSYYSKEKTTIIILTASLDSKNDKQKLKNVGINPNKVLFKPLDGEELLKAIFENNSYGK